MAGVTPDDLVIAIHFVRYVIKLGRMRGPGLILGLKNAVSYADIVQIELSEPAVAGITGAVGWLEIILHHPSGIEPQRHSIEECLKMMKAKAEMSALLKKCGQNILEFYGDEFRVAVSTERYLDRLYLIETTKSAPPKNKTSHFTKRRKNA